MASLSSAQSKVQKSPEGEIAPIETVNPDQQSLDRSVSGNNPFLATTPSERDANFPSFDRALLIDSGIVDSSIYSVSGRSSSVCGGTNFSGDDRNNLDHLSISARAALAEHNLHIARFGIDSSLEVDNHDVAFPKYSDPLDAEWERLILNTTASDVNLSHISPNQSSLSAALYTTKPEEHIVVATSSSDGRNIEAIELLTEVSCSDFLNTSRVIDVLRTPEHIRSRAHDLSPKNDGVTVRERAVPSSINPYDSSEASFSDDSSRMLRHMYLNSLRSQLPHPSDSVSSRSPSSRTRADDQESFSLYNVDISRISADDDNESIAAKNLDNSFTDVGIVFPDPMNNFTGTPSKPRHEQLTVNELNTRTPKRDKRWRDNTSTPTFNADRELAAGTEVLHQHYPFDEGQADEENAVESKLATMALSPISKQAADRAISILQSSPDWNNAFSPARNSDFTASTFFHTDVQRPQQLVHDDLFLYPNIMSNSKSDDDDTSPDVILEFKSSSEEQKNDANNDSNDDRFYQINDFTSPLHSSSEDKRESEDSKNNQSNLSAGTGVTPEVLANSGSSEDHLKTNSLSSISPNSSSEHHITTKPTANSSSSLSASTKFSAKPEKDFDSSANNYQHTWSDFTDRRRYRTVVPIRVFISEPNLFPNEDDSFSSEPKQLSLSLPPYNKGSSSKRRGFNREWRERSI